MNYGTNYGWIIGPTAEYVESTKNMVWVIPSEPEGAVQLEDTIEEGYYHWYIVTHLPG